MREEHEQAPTVPEYHPVCDHDFSVMPWLVWQIDETVRDGTQNRAIYFFYHYYCTKCLGTQYVRVPGIMSDTDSWDDENPKYGALPRAPQVKT